MRPPVAVEWRASSTLFTTKQSPVKKCNLRGSEGHNARTAKPQNQTNPPKGQDPLPVTSTEEKFHFRPNKIRPQDVIACNKSLSATREHPASQNTYTIPISYSPQGTASTTRMAEASLSKQRTAGVEGVSREWRRCLGGGRGLGGPGLLASSRLPSLPSPFEPPRNATSPAHAHPDCWWWLFPGLGG